MLSRTHINVDVCTFAFANTCFAFANQCVPGYITTTARTKAIPTIYTHCIFLTSILILQLAVCVCEYVLHTWWKTGTLESKPADPSCARLKVFLWRNAQDELSRPFQTNMNFPHAGTVHILHFIQYVQFFTCPFIGQKNRCSTSFNYFPQQKCMFGPLHSPRLWLRRLWGDRLRTQQPWKFACWTLRLNRSQDSKTISWKNCSHPNHTRFWSMQTKQQNIFARTTSIEGPQPEAPNTGWFGHNAFANASRFEALSPVRSTQRASHKRKLPPRR